MTSRVATVLAFLVASMTGCGSSSTEPLGSSVPAAPVPPSVPSAPAQPAAPPSFPILPEKLPVAIYTGGPTSTQFVLYSDGTFRLEYARFWYTGSYSKTDTKITFEFDYFNKPDGASATLHGDILHVRFEGTMGLADFEDGSYVFSPAATQRARSVKVYAGGPEDSRYLLYADGTFRLDHPGIRYFTTGTYAREGSSYTFSYNDWSGYAYSTGQIDRDVLAVRYNSYMGDLGFGDGHFSLTSPLP